MQQSSRLQRIGRTRSARARQMPKLLFRTRQLQPANHPRRGATIECLPAALATSRSALIDMIVFQNTCQGCDCGLADHHHVHTWPRTRSAGHEVIPSWQRLYRLVVFPTTRHLDGTCVSCPATLLTLMPCEPAPPGLTLTQTQPCRPNPNAGRDAQRRYRQRKRDRLTTSATQLEELQEQIRSLTLEKVSLSSRSRSYTRLP